MKQIGFINAKGEIVIPARELMSVKSFQDGVAAVNINGKFGFINTKGEELIPMNYKLLAAKDGYYHMEPEPWKAGVSHGGKFVLPCEFNSVDVRGVADGMITAYDNNRRLGFYNLQGEKVIDHKYFSSENLEGNDFTYFSEGLAPVCTEEYGAVGFINKAGEMVIEPQYPCRRVRPFSEGLAYVGNGKYIDTTGKVAVQLSDDYTDCGDFHGGVAVVAKANKARTQSKAGAINLKGKEVIKCSYNEVEAADGAYIATKGTSWRNQVKHIFAADGKRVGGDYKTVLDVYRGVVIAQTDEGAKVWVNTVTGEVYGEDLGVKSINRMREGLVFAITPDFTGFLDVDAKKVIDLSWIPGLTASQVGNFAGGFCPIINPAFVGFIDATGAKALDLTADPVLSKATAFGPFSEGLASFTIE